MQIALAGLMRRYSQRVPDVIRIIKCMIQAGMVRSAEDIENDHIAFRTMGVPHLGIASLEKIFLTHGYQRRDRFDFAAKKLNAYWYSPPDPVYPRVFISELRVGDLSPQAQQIITSYTSAVTADPVDELDLQDGAAMDEFLHSPLWRTPTLVDYLALAKESEYAAWVIYNRYYLNHFTISVHSLPDGYNTIEHFNEFLLSHGFRLNDAGGVIKVSEDGLLKQSSTVAQMVTAQFVGQDGQPLEHEIAGSYVEFAERKPLPQFASLSPDQIQRQHRRDGFEAGNADKIFESTYSKQTDRKD
jgi:hypothetical protein